MSIKSRITKLEKEQPPSTPVYYVYFHDEEGYYTNPAPGGERFKSFEELAAARGWDISNITKSIVVDYVPDV